MPPRPIYGRCISPKERLFRRRRPKIDLIFAQSNASVIQQLARAPMAVAPSAGWSIRFAPIDKGRAVALVRIVIQSPPYALLAKPEIKRIEDLKGKTIIIGGAKDITRIFTERMLEPHGLKTGDYDYVFAGATSARFAALKSGASCRAPHRAVQFLTPRPRAYTNLGFTFDYLPDMPFAGMAVNPRLGGGEYRRAQAVSRLLQQGRRLVRRSEQPRGCGQAADGGEQDRPGRRGKSPIAFSAIRSCSSLGKVSKRKVGNVIDALRDLGDLPAGFTVDRLVLPGVTQISD